MANMTSIHAFNYVKKAQEQKHLANNYRDELKLLYLISLR